jgi:hypothetical protein
MQGPTAMGPIPKMLSVVLLLGCLDSAVAMAGEPACDGPYKGHTLTPEELATVLRKHQAWLKSDGNRDDERRANLCQADLREANLRNASLYTASLQGADLREANLFKAFLWGANLQGANLHEANMQGATLWEADFQEANLFRAFLRGANLRGANLRGANLTQASLEGTNLRDVNLQDADLWGTNLEGAIYEPHPGKLPSSWTLTEPENKLETLVFCYSPAALMALREALKKAGMRTQERQLTYAIEHTKRLQAWDPRWIDPKREDTRPWPEQLVGKSESLFNYVLFELPSGYGMAPSRALTALGLLILVFALVYMVALVAARGRAGIWVTWPTDRVYKQEGPAGEGETSPSRVTSTFIFPRLQAWAARRRWHIWSILLRGLSILLIGLYFSLLSAFSLGWRELNVGTWIARVQSREYVLRATGWVRTVAGIQSLLSVYLLALWVLTYFGRPFE